MTHREMYRTGLDKLSGDEVFDLAHLLNKTQNAGIACGDAWPEMLRERITDFMHPETD